jgi:serine/threonine protein kinase
MAIGYLHKRGIAHRDLKLENILVDQEGYIKVIDYGLAKILKETDDPSFSFCGTPEYLAPEMVNGSGHDKAVDWWAMGVIIYEVLVGVTPFFNRNK